MMGLVGSDIDGVLAAGFIPEEKDYVIISGRMFWEWRPTVALLGFSRPIYLRPNGGDGNGDSAGHWKAYMINELGVEKFYEDDPAQIAIIRSKCPQCKVVRIVNGRISNEG